MKPWGLVACIIPLIGCTGAEPVRDPDALTDSTEALIAVAQRRFTRTVDSARAGFLQSLLRARDSLVKEVESSKGAVERAAKERAQILTGLPGSITLDSLNAYYAERWDSSGFSERFETRAGNLVFRKEDFDFAYLPSNGLVAYIRIGKTGDAYASREVIQSWLREATEVKRRLGYSRIYTRTRPAEYGEVTEELYEKGDAYAKTYFRYSRVQGTYGRFSLEYDYYIEVGSKARAEQYRAERYNQRLGS